MAPNFSRHFLYLRIFVLGKSGNLFDCFLVMWVSDESFLDSCEKDPCFFGIMRHFFRWDTPGVRSSVFNISALAGILL